MIYLLNKEEMETLFKRIREEYVAFGTVEREGELVFEEVTNFESIKEGRSRYAPKEFLIARNEDVLSTVAPEKKAVIGIMSCDLKGFQVMDKQIMGKDPFYTAKRENTLFINFPCKSICEGGFCDSFGGPFLDKYQIQIISEKNEFVAQAAEEYDKFFKGFRKSGDSKIDEFKQSFMASARGIKVSGIENRIKWNSNLWKKYASACISCGACNYSCPTCYCFDLYDLDETRLREWDSCILPGFTSTSAGNVRGDLSERLRQRFYHKFVYYKKSQGEYLCTGCNRCTEDCPVDIDIKEVVTHDYTTE